MNNFVGNMSNYMTYLTARRNVISNNVANANTPGYKAKDVTFIQQLEGDAPAAAGSKTAFYQTNPMHLPPSLQGRSSYEVVTKSGSAKQDGNGVDVTNEMVELVKTNQLYSISINALNTQFTIDQAARGK
ncbi:flagellar basal body rod protein FlgB [Ectobacillus ponti]|uniref:Flagellar basal body rod protein FlgB n=1 Tax=Ectobacillus ponti TaxID=2961894 RepID=A0AA41X4M0_9BACI|nr:flagellar basal body rod protein FlgB [Ectobacillus ponti]